MNGPRILVAIALAGAALAVGASPAAATNECRGLMVCVPVTGPWVLVPTGSGVPRPHVEFQLSCPRGYIVGGLDAELTDRSIDILFLGTLGSPVNPGVTTSRAALFVASLVRTSAHTPSFRPHIGCMPASGGGGIPALATRIVPPGKPTIRRVRDVPLASGRRRVVQRCAPGERLVAASHAVGFFIDDPPGARLAASITAVQAVRGNGVTVSVRTRAAARDAGPVLQVDAVCAGGQ